MRLTDTDTWNALGRPHKKLPDKNPNPDTKTWNISLYHTAYDKMYKLRRRISNKNIPKSVF